MTIRVLVNGASGKMGQACVKAIEAADGLALVGATSARDTLAHAIQKNSPNVVVDFTTPDVVFKNTKTIIEQGVHPVIGTTGLSHAEQNTLTAMCAQQALGGLIVPNFSIGAVLMMHYAAEVAKHFDAVEIIELHHDKKKDAPSGTALRTAKLIETSGKKNQHSVPIHSVRLPGLLAHQIVLFGGPGETFTLRHDTTDRSAFMPGVVLACRQVSTLTCMHIGLEHLLLANADG